MLSLGSQTAAILSDSSQYKCESLCRDSSRSGRASALLKPRAMLTSVIMLHRILSEIFASSKGAEIEESRTVEPTDEGRLRAAQKAGGLPRGGVRGSGSFGRGRAASLAAARLLNDRARGTMVKARVVRRMRSPGALRAHIGYLKRDGITRDGSPGKLFDAA